MKKVIVVAAQIVLVLVAMATVQAEERSVYEISATTIDGVEQKLSAYSGKVLLVVNVASYCGYTSQYAGLEKLYRDYKDKGFVVLGFPCNDFGQQEPENESEIKKFCSARFGVSFPLFSKVKVLGAEKNSLYRLLVAATGGADVGWNFEKFLINRTGEVVGRFVSGVEPESDELKKAIEKALS